MERRNWIDRNLVMIIKFLECLGPRVQLNIYTSSTSIIAPADIFYGIDYIDEIPEHIFDFIKASRTLTLHSGLIVSLRSNGIYSGSVAVNMLIQNKDVQYENKVSELNASVCSIKKQLENETYNSSEYQSSLEINGKIYHHRGMSFSRKGIEYIYESDDHSMIKSEYEDAQKCLHRFLIDSLYKLEMVHEIYGTSTDCCNYISRNPFYNYLYKGLSLLIPLIILIG
jgi:hypothetical protein